MFIVLIQEYDDETPYLRYMNSVKAFSTKEKAEAFIRKDSGETDIENGYVELIEDDVVKTTWTIFEDVEVDQ